MTANSFTLYIAFYGAILSTALFLWNIYLHFTDKGKLKVQCYIAFLYNGKSNSEKLNNKNIKLCYNITNIGKKPITVEQVGLEVDYGEKRAYISSVSKTIPVFLNPGGSCKEYTDHHDSLHLKIKSVWAKDSLGKMYKLKKRDLKKLLNAETKT